jgi:hypothetical protein
LTLTVIMTLGQILRDCASLHHWQIEERSRRLERSAASGQWLSLELAALDSMPVVQQLLQGNASAADRAYASSSDPSQLLALWRQALAVEAVEGARTLAEEDVWSPEIFAEELRRELRAARAQLQTRVAQLYSQLASVAADLCEEVLQLSFNATSALSLSIQDSMQQPPSSRRSWRGLHSRAVPSSHPTTSTSVARADGEERREEGLRAGPLSYRMPFDESLGPLRNLYVYVCFMLYVTGALAVRVLLRCFSCRTLKP